MRSITTILTAAVLAASLTGCAAIQRQVCNTDKAYQAGKTDAQAWDTSKKGLQGASFCDGSEYPVSSYQKDYTAGFRDTMMVQCENTGIHSLAAADAQAGKLDRLNSGQFKACESVDKSADKVALIYSAEFQKEYCTSDRVAGLATNAANSFSAPNMDWTATCTRNGLLLKTAYNRAYTDAISAKCSELNVAQMAYNDADAGAPIQTGLDRMRACPLATQHAALTQYEHSYNQRVDLITRQTGHAPGINSANTPTLGVIGGQQAMTPIEQDRVRASRVNFSLAGQQVYSTCRILPGGQSTEVSVSNQGMSPVFVSKNWNVDVYDVFGRIIRRNTRPAMINVRGLQTTTFQVPTETSGAVACKAVAMQ